MLLSDPDLAYLKAFVEEVLAVIHNDDVGVTFGLEDIALNSGRILGLEKTYMDSIE